MEEQIVIACYKPKMGKKEELNSLMRTHYETLNKLGLVSDRRPILMEASDGTVIEVFGWKSKDAIASAHSNPTVLKMWEEYGKACDYVPIASVPGAGELFTGFVPL